MKLSAKKLGFYILVLAPFMHVESASAIKCQCPIVAGHDLVAVQNAKPGGMVTIDGHDWKLYDSHSPLKWFSEFNTNSPKYKQTSTTNTEHHAFTTADLKKEISCHYVVNQGKGIARENVGFFDLETPCE